MNESAFPQGEVWDIFKLILSVPHPSGKEHNLVKKIADESEKRGLQIKIDSYGNLRVDRKASPGFEHLPTVIFQGHLDMVCEKSSEIEFDFDKDGIKTEIKDGFLHACGTTLGADNGIGSALALAMLWDKQYVGRAIAGVFTREEETGLTGAANLEADMLEGKYLLNLDSDAEGSFCIGCAGGTRLAVDLDVLFSDSIDGYSVEIAVSGLPGGHSGVEIDKKHGNALTFLAGILEKTDVDVTDIYCQNADNVIPSSATAKVISKKSPEELADICRALASEYKNQLSDDAELEVKFSLLETPRAMWDVSWRRKIISVMANLPNEVIEFAPEFGVPRTSSNFAAARVDNGVLKLRFSQRSLENAKRVEATNKVIEAFDGLDCRVKASKEYSGWKPVKDARINSVAAAVWRDMYGTEPDIHVIHAGLETGVLSMKNPELELISFGPTALDIHSIKERLDIASVDRVYKFIQTLVKQL